MSSEELEINLAELLSYSKEQIQRLYESEKKLVLYTILAGKENLQKKVGQFQLLSADLVYDDRLNPFLLEFNTGTGFYTKERVDRYVVPQLIQSMLDIILHTHKDMSQMD